MSTIVRCYHWLMFHYYKWQMKREIIKMKQIGRENGLPSLDEYSDEAIVEGFRRLKQKCDEKNNE